MSDTSTSKELAGNGGKFTFTLKSAAQRSGVSVHTIRAWERRYGAITPTRDAHGRRIFSEEQMERLILLATLVRAGHRISAIAGHSTRQLAELQARDEGIADKSALPTAAVVERIVAAAAANDEAACHRMIASAIMTLEPIKLVRNVLSPLMNLVGSEWAAGRISVAQEHMVTAIVKRRMMSIMEALRLAEEGPHIVLATLAGERHELGALFAAFFAACRHLRVTYLGPDLPGRDLAGICADIGADIIGISVVHLPAETDVPAEFAALMRDRPKAAEIWLGGAALDDPAAIPGSSKCAVFKTIDQYWERLDGLV